MYHSILKLNTNKSAFIFLIITLILSCNKAEEKALPGVEPVTSYPNCQLLEEKTITYHNSTERHVYGYENGKRTSKSTYYNEVYNSTRLYTYDQNGFPEYILTFDSSTSVTDTLALFEHNSTGRLEKFVHFDLYDGGILSSTEYIYNSKGLSRIVGVEEDTIHFIISAETDGNENLTNLKLVSYNGLPPDHRTEVDLEYDRFYSPYYKLADFTEGLFFSKNNIIREVSYSDGDIYILNFDYEYEEHNLVSRRITRDEDGDSDTTFYNYLCN